MTEGDGQNGRTGRDESDREREGLIPEHGAYRKLKSFQIAQLAYDVTVRFCDRYIDRRSRTHDQMVQAARSGVQNIAEGSIASGTSKKTELKLTNVPAPAWKNCASTMRITFGSEDCLSGRRKIPGARDWWRAAAQPLMR